MYKSTDQTKTNQQNKIEQTKNNKGNNFLRIKTSKRVVGLICIFLHVKSFHKKSKSFYCTESKNLLVIFAGFRKLTVYFC